LERLARNRPDATNIWRHLAKTAERAGRHDLASEAYRHVLSREPDAVDAQLGAAQASFQLRRFEDARRRAEAVVSLAADIEPATTARGYELLVRIALARQDPATAFARALEGQNAQPGLPLIAYVDGRVLQDAGRDEEAVEAFERAAGELNSSHGAIRLADLHLRAAESLIRLDRLEEAESQYAEEIAAFPHSIAARAGLATLFHTTGQSEQAGAAIADLLQFTPTPDAYNLAARLWTTFGNVDQASQTRAEAARLFAAPLSRTTQQ
ncbi:MAG: tetratricopeptide repeat protein, partial [Vicinamibacterales bacterium]